MPQPRGQRRPSNWDSDPLLKGADWEAVKAYWRRLRWPCQVCGQAIDYDGPPCSRSLDVGHWPVSRDQARAAGWTRAMTNAVTNTRPECRTCSRSSGASYGNAKRREPTPRPIEADEW